MQPEKDVFLSDVAAYRGRGIRHITSFGVFLKVADAGPALCFWARVAGNIMPGLTQGLCRLPQTGTSP